MEGVLIVDKPKNVTSHDVVDLVRRTFNVRKVGHAGTLDPMATGILVLLVGRYTKDAASFMADEKEYVATMILGARSDTGDADGVVSVHGSLAGVTKEKIEEACAAFRGEISQIPPMFSAVKYKGRRLYHFARKGIQIKRSPRKVFIHALELIRYRSPEADIRVVCSKGTYIRQLCVDIGDRLGCGAYVSALRRVRCGRFKIDEAVSVDTLRELSPEGLMTILGR